MKMKRSLWSFVGAGVAIAAMVFSATPAQAAVGADASDAPSLTLRYSDLDVVDFLVFARGPIARDKPELVDQLNMTPVLDAPESVSQQVLTDLVSVDPDFHANVTAKAQANDPYEAEASLQNFTADVNAVAAKYKVAPGTLSRSKKAANGQVWAFSNYVVSVQVAVAAAVAVSVIGVIAALAVIAYQRPGDSSGITAQKYAASWAAL